MTDNTTKSSALQSQAEPIGASRPSHNPSLHRTANKTVRRLIQVADGAPDHGDGGAHLFNRLTAREPSSGIISPCFAAKQHRSAKLKLRSRETVGNRHAARSSPADATT
jgi:hypothetical protein